MAGIAMGEGMAMSQFNAEPPDPRNPHILAVLPQECFEFEAVAVYRVTIEKELED